MSTEKQTENSGAETTERMEVVEMVSGDPQPHQDQYVHYTHEMTNDTAEASARALMRIVPLAYGVLLGGLTESMFLGLSVGLALSLAADVAMADKSIFRGLFRRQRHQ
jgi:hypothetical protein